MQNILHKIKPHFEKDGKLHALYPAYDAFETFLFVPTGQTFGSNTSPSNWELLARARTDIEENILKHLKPVLETLKIKHITYLKKMKLR